MLTGKREKEGKKGYYTKIKTATEQTIKARRLAAKQMSLNLL